MLKQRIRFEKSLYDLIRGLRNHKGKEPEYIQESLRECQKEIKSQDMGSYDRFFDLSWELRTIWFSSNFMIRLEGHSFVKAYLSRNVRTRHVMGIIQRTRSYVFTKLSPKAGWLLGCYTELSCRYRGPYACGELTEEGLFWIVSSDRTLLTSQRI